MNRLLPAAITILVALTASPASAVRSSGSADLSVTMMDFPDPVTVGAELTYTIKVKNSGPAGATGVTATDSLPAEVGFVSVASTQGSCAGTSPLICTLGGLAKNATATVTIKVRPTAGGMITNGVNVKGDQPDSRASNNSATTSTTVKSSAGQLDPGFGTGGLVTTSSGDRNERAMGVALQEDGKIVIAGGRSLDFAVLRYDTSGRPDPTFGTGGIVTTSFVVGTALGYDVAIYRSGPHAGKIVVAGTAAGNFALARYLPDGTLDPSFGVGGRVTTAFSVGPGGAAVPLSSRAEAVAIQPDGRIVAAGCYECGGLAQFAVARWNADGTLDTSFGQGGMVATHVGDNVSYARDLALQPDGRIVVAGSANNGPGYRWDFALARYQSNGSLDTSFGGDGRVRTEFPGDAMGSTVALQTDGNIVVAGDNMPPADVFQDDFALARYTPDGSLDTTFGIGGKVTSDNGGRIEWSQSVLIQTDGKILAVGTSFADRPEFTVARYTLGGSLDTSFGKAGWAYAVFPGSDGEALDAAIQADGKIVASGGASFNGDGLNDHDFALARYLG